MNETATQIWNVLSAAYPEWRGHRRERDSGDLEVFVPSPNSAAGGLLVLTSGDDVWLGLATPYMRYPIDDADELLSLIELLLRDEVFFVSTTRDGEWTGTTLVRAGDDVAVEPGEAAQVVSWSGEHDRTLTAGD